MRFASKSPQRWAIIRAAPADMAKLADALDSGSRNRPSRHGKRQVNLDPPVRACNSKAHFSRHSFHRVTSCFARPPSLLALALFEHSHRFFETATHQIERRGQPRDSHRGRSRTVRECRSCSCRSLPPPRTWRSPAGRSRNINRRSAPPALHWWSLQLQTRSSVSGTRRRRRPGIATWGSKQFELQSPRRPSIRSHYSSHNSRAWIKVLP
jgi:hypothetical protein